MKLFLLFAFILTFSLYASDTKQITLQLVWKHQFQFAGYYMAKELGYYKQEGLDVNIKEYNYGINTTDEVLHGKAEFAVGRSSLIIDKSENKDIVALAAIYQKSPLMLLVRKDSGINTVKDFKNKRIMMTNDAKTTASIMAMLQSNGVYKNDFIRQPHSFNLQDLIDKKTDAMASYISNEPLKLDQKEIPYKIFHPKDYGFSFYSDILFTSTKFLNEDEELVRKFYDASIKGWEYAFENIIKTSEVIYNKYNTQNKSLLDLILEGKELKKLAYHEELKTIGALDKRLIEKTIDTYNILGLLKDDIDVDKFIYEGNGYKVINFEFEENELILILIISIMIFFFILFILLFISVKSKLLHTTKELQKQIELQTKKINKQHQIILTQSRIAAVGEMISHIAHQWRQPLSSITLQTSNIQASLAFNEKISDETLLKTMKFINNNCQYLSDTIDDFRSFFQNQSTGKQILCLKHVINKVINLTKDSLYSNQIQLIGDYDKHLEINANESAIVQVLLNLVNNAKDALILNNIPEENRFIFITTKQEKSKYLIIVKDSGGGINEEIIEKIFDPYFSTKHPSQGTGIGLYMAYQILTQQLEGDITVKNVNFTYNNKKLKGAEFKLIL